MINKNFISLINHASILVSNGNKSILTDPWYFGDVFDGGWNLLFENNIHDLENILKKVDYIWISHEHPDHFSVQFFNKFDTLIKSKNIKILFQETRDKRVVNFLKKQGYSVTELKDGEKYKIDKNYNIITQKYDFYDSALILQIDNFKIFNLNDCPMNEEREILKFKKKYGTCDFLLSQFSYAAWKGGKANLEWRKQAAELKLKTIIKQSKILESKYTIPFASFVYFSSNYNYYLNDSVNKPSIIMNATIKEKTNFIFLKPYIKLILDNPKISEEGNLFWEDKFNSIKIRNKKITSCSFEDLEKLFNLYIIRIFKKNSYIFCKILSKLPFLKIFKPIIIKIKDLNIVCKIDIAQKSFIKTNIKPDVEMNSSSLKLIFSADYGFDTLTINGCFEEKQKNGFLKMTQSLALGNLNNLSIFLNFKIFLNFFVILLFLKKVLNVQKKLTFKYVQKIE